MKKMGNRCNRQMMRRIASAVLALVLFFGMLPTSFLQTEAHWTDEYINTLVDWGVMRGDVSGNMNAEKPITRAEFVAMVNRAFGYVAATEHPFTDVTTRDWYNNDIGMAYNMGYFKGTGTTTASPNSPLTREQAVVLIGRNLLLDEKLGETLGFADSRTFSEWSRGMVESAIHAGFISGYDDGSFKPQRQVTRGEVAAMLVKAIGTLVNKSGTHELGGVYGNVMISTSGVKLKNTTIAGDLYITGGLELGDVMLENVTVLGKIIISGSGESHKGDSSIVLRNVEAGELVLNSIAGQFVTLRAEGDTQIDFTNVRTSAYLDDQTEAGDGLLYIELNGENGMTVTLAGNIEEVLNRTPESVLTMAQGNAQIITVDEKATGSTLDIKNIASIDKLNLDTGVPVTGEGDVKDVYINAAGSVVDMLPDKIEIRPGLTADINGEEMDTQAGQESSSEPRILSGYPKIKNLAPNSVEVVYSANKKGTIYWALTSLIDGPVKVEDLLEVKDYNTKILQQGTINVTESNKEFRIKISKLLSDGSYYVSAVLVDSRDQKSPVKYITFTTPDGTAPGFATGYPELIQITMNNAQVSVMPTKTSTLYYAVLPKGAAAPTIAEFKAGAISGDLGNCPREGISVTKNVVSFSWITSEESPRLKELESYELYLCLIDPDNGKDSGVKRLSFTTVDGTPPELADAIPTGVQKNSIKLTTSMNENGIIYWVAVKEGDPYPVLPSNLPADTDIEKITQMQIINGMGNVVKAGKANATANKDVVLNITGLQPESGYDIYYVAQDKAGNCSVVKMINQKTLDTAAPTARQEFTKTADAAGLNPLPETDIRVIFSEGVRNKDSDKTFAQLWEAYKKAAPGTPAADSALADLVRDLEKSIQLWDVSNPSASYVVEHDNTMGPDDVGTWINYEKVEIEVLDTEEYAFVFKHGEAISLSSGSTYQIVLEDITDTSDLKNPMKPNPFKLDPFTTVFAQVNLTTRGSGNMNLAGLPTMRGSTEADASEADVDMHFWMTPQSTDSVNSNVNYDVWIETNGVIVYFDLYCRVLDLENGGFVTVPPYDPNNPDQESGLSMFEKKADIMDAAGWMYLGQMELYASGGVDRGSVNALINGQNTTSISPLNSLNDKYAYEFIVDVNTINESTNEQSWSENVTLNILVPAGQDLRGTDYGKADPLTGDVVNIGNPEDFSVSRKFIDTVTPKFIGGYPTFEVGDSAANVNVMLDRAGTLYYVVAPLVEGADGLATTIATTVVYADDTTETPIPFADWFVKSDAETGVVGTPAFSGSHLDHDFPLGTDSTGRKYQVTEPTRAGVALLVDKGAGDVNIKTGKVQIGVTRQTFQVKELTPETTYLVYCILKGESQEYSNVYMFQFTTKKMSVPTIGLNVNGSTVAAKTSTPADMNWAVYAYDTIIKIPVFKKTFTDCVPDELEDQLLLDCRRLNLIPQDSTDLSGITVLKALQTSMSTTDDRSLFDVYADADIRKDVVEYVQAETSDITNKQTDLGSTKFPEANRVQNIVPKNLSPETVYYFVAVARNALGEEYAFKAIGSLRLPDVEAPQLESYNTSPHEFAASVYPNGLSDYNKHIQSEEVQANPKAYAYKGTIRISFSEPIYQKVTGSDGIPVVTPPDASSFSSTGRVTVTDAKLDGSTLVIYFEGATEGNTITIFGNGVISDKDSNSDDDHKRLVLTFTSVSKMAGTVGGMEVFVADPHFEIKWDDTAK